MRPMGWDEGPGRGLAEQAMEELLFFSVVRTRMMTDVPST